MEIGGRRFTTLRGEFKCPGYMLKMLTVNNPRNMMPFCVSYEGMLPKVLYETDTCMTIRDFLMENGADEQWIKNFLITTDMMLSICSEFLIDPSYIMVGIDRVYFSADTGHSQFLFNPFEKVDFTESFRKLIADIAGNYFIDHAVSGEIFRERLLREVGKKDFSVRNILARWEELSYASEEQVKEKHLHGEKEEVKRSLFKGLIDGFKKKDDLNATAAVTNTTGCMCLTGICSINTRIPIKEEGVTVGRTMLQKEYGLYNSGIGKTHARVYSQDGNVYATDLGSKNGTYLNGELLDKRVPVTMEKGDILAFSDEEFILC